MTGCELGLANERDIDFAWQAADLSNGLLLGIENTPIDLPADMPTAVLLRLVAGSPIDPTELVIDAWCADGQGTSPIVGLNTLEFSASAVPTADIVALAVSASDDGTVRVPGNDGYGFFSMATTNVGADSEIDVIPSITGNPDGEALVCRTDPLAGTCTAQPSASVSLVMGAAETATVAVFVRVAESFEFPPALNRVSISFVDSDGTNRGRTSLALR